MKHLIPSVKLSEIQNPPPLDFQDLKINKYHNENLSVSLNMLDDDDKPHMNEVTYNNLQSVTNYEV